MTALKDSVVWITGASSGIGEAIAYELAKRGSIVALTARSDQKLAQLCAHINAGGGRAYKFVADVLDLEGLTLTAKQIESSIGPIEILIANAGTHVFSRPEQFDSAEYLSLMDINFGGMLRSFEAALPAMLARGRGHVVGVASMAGYRGLPRAAAYGASKAAMIHFLESLRFHLKHKGLRVTVCNPGFVKTPLTDKNNFKMPFLISAEAAARIICDGILSDRKVIAFPWVFNAIMRLMQHLPAFIYEPIIDAVERRMNPL